MKTTSIIDRARQHAKGRALKDLFLKPSEADRRFLESLSNSDRLDLERAAGTESQLAQDTRSASGSIDVC